MASLRLEILQAVVMRVILAAIGVSAWLRSRMEVATPPNGLDNLADAAFLVGASSGSAGALGAPGLVLPFTRATQAAVLPAAVLGAAADAVAAAALRALAIATGQPPRQALDIAVLYLWNPLTMASCLSGSADPLKVAAALGAAAAAAAGRPVAAGAALGLCLHFAAPQAAVLALPVAFLALRRQGAAGRQRCGAQLAAGFAIAAAAAALAGGAFLTGFWAASARSLPARTAAAACAAVGLPCSSGPVNDPLSPTPASPAASLAASYAGKQPWSGVTPNLGLQWYLFAEAFPVFRPFFLYVFGALTVGLGVAVALRFKRAPVVALAAQGIVLCMLGRHPVYADTMLWLGLAPLVLSDVGGRIPRGVKAALGLGLPACLALNTAAHELWLVLGTGNANFFYGMNLLWAGWQAVALVQLLRAAAAAEEKGEKPASEVPAAAGGRNG